MTCWLRVKAPLYFYCSALNTPKVHALSASLLPSISFQFPRFLLIPRRTGCHCSTSTDFPHGAAWTWQYSPPGSISKTQPVQHRHWPEWLLGVHTGTAKWACFWLMAICLTLQLWNPMYPGLWERKSANTQEFPTFSDTYEHEGYQGGMVPRVLAAYTPAPRRGFVAVQGAICAELWGVRGLCPGF